MSNADDPKFAGLGCVGGPPVGVSHQSWITCMRKVDYVGGNVDILCKAATGQRRSLEPSGFTQDRSLPALQKGVQK